MRPELNTFAQHQKIAKRKIWQYDVKKSYVLRIGLSDIKSQYTNNSVSVKFNTEHTIPINFTNY